MAAPELTFHALSRNGLVLAGLLLLSVGLGDAIAGRAKLAQYEELARAAPASAPRDATTLFPTTEGQERARVAQAKLGFYQLLFMAGQLLAALGFVLLVMGVIRMRLVALRAALPPPVCD